MSEKRISRRGAFSLLGLAAVFGLAVPTSVLTTSDAEAQVQPTAPVPSAPASSGTEQRQERRTGRTERRAERRTGRTKRREARRTGRTERREARRKSDKLYTKAGDTKRK